MMAHTNFGLVSRILKKLDHPDNTIYVHIDAKSLFSKEDEELLLSSCQASKVILVDRRRVNWGGYSQIQLEMHILNAAVCGQYDYYHFLSGVDFPTKPMADIYDFFEKHTGYEFIHFCSDEFTRQQAHRYCRYHFLQEKCGRAGGIVMFAEKGLLLMQKILGINRAKKHKGIQFKSGSNWISITHKFALYLLSKEKEIHDLFSRSLCCDEFFVQTMAYNSPFKENIFVPANGASMLPNLRSVDWARGDQKLGSPYTYTVADYEDLVASKNLFCRKVTDSTPEGNALIQKLEQL